MEVIMTIGENQKLNDVLYKDIQIARLYIETYDRETEEELKVWLSKLTQSLLAQQPGESAEA